MTQQGLFKPVLGAIALGGAGVAIAHYTGRNKLVMGGICAVGGFIAGYLTSDDVAGRAGSGEVKARFRKISHPKYQIFEVISDEKGSLTNIFMRPQEHYENKDFKNKIFVIPEIKKWFYDRGSRDVYGGWIGFNLPDYVFKIFFDGGFNPLSIEEEWLLNNIKQSVDFKKPYYIIGYYDGKDSVYKHELAHALYYLSPEYRREANRILSSFNSNPTFNPLHKFLESQYYHESVYLDEAHAYLVADREDMIKNGVWNEKYEPYHRKLNRLFDLYFNV